MDWLLLIFGVLLAPFAIGEIVGEEEEEEEDSVANF